MKRVLVFGTFDILHRGHLWFLKAAKRHGDELTVVVTRDRSARAAGKHPRNTERDRLKLVQALQMVDRALLGDSPGRWTMIRKLRPDVICIGYDQRTNHPGIQSQLKSFKKPPKLITIKPLKPRRYRSSRFITKAISGKR